ncbi:MAG: TonB-dependent receptor plug domain-containing protein [Schleiferiaceae bacterium]
MRQLFAILFLLTCSLASAQIMDTTLLDEVEVRESRPEDERTLVKGKDIEFTTGAEGGVEGVVKTFAGVSSRNELSSQYNVRGGNFDENLVYINGFEVFRPFLARAGQQEGMSIIHPHLVGNILFSAGGFSALYGDKLSSVLDVQYKRGGEELDTKVESSLTGVNISATKAGMDWEILSGFRYRNNALLLNATDIQSDYFPSNADGQILARKWFDNGTSLEIFGHLSHNRMNQVPQNRETSFGSLQEALRLTVFFDGQENFGYDTQFLAARWNQRLGRGFRSLSATGFHTTEREITDVIGYYRLSELNNDLGSDDFGEISLVRGVGAFQDYRRNFLDAYIVNAKYAEGRFFDAGKLNWGATVQGENIYDRYKEFQRIDSAGYSLPHRESQLDSVIGGRLYSTPLDNLDLYTHVSATQLITNTRLKGYVNWEGKWATDKGIWTYNAGVRTQYATLNGELRISPRFKLFYKPNEEGRTFTIAAGLYDQYPFYREMRQKDGVLNTEVQSQNAMHFTVRSDKDFEMWGRPFVWSFESYYKDLNRVNLYDIENVRIRYAANNNAIGRIYGFDSRVNGEFVQGTDSWFTFSLFKAEERPTDDFAQGWFARPTDTRFNFAVYFQDYLPNDPSTRLSLTLMVGGGFPFGPDGPGDGISDPWERVFRSPPYRRADIGFIKVLKGKWTEQFDEVWVSAEIFNLLQARNTVSYLWVRDVSAAGQYAVPNYMTNRLINFKMHVDL